MRPILYGLGVILLMIFGKFVYSSFSKGNNFEEKPKTGKDAKPMKVNTLALSNVSTENVLFASGTCSPNEDVEIKSEISGIITHLYLKEGQSVQKGQVLAKIKDTDLIAQIKKNDIDAKLALQIEARQKKLLEINAISKEEFELAENKYLLLNAEKEILKTQLAKTIIKCPFSGRLGLKNISEGAYVTPSNVIVTVTQSNPIKIDFSVPEKYISLVKVGESVNFLIEGDSNPFVARVVALDPKIDPNIRAIKVRAKAVNPSNKLLPGMFLKIKLNINTLQAIMIPSECIIPTVDGKKVFVKRNGMAEEQKIETGLRTNKMVQVINGLNVNDSLITSSLITIKKGTPVISKN